MKNTFKKFVAFLSGGHFLLSDELTRWDRFFLQTTKTRMEQINQNKFILKNLFIDNNLQINYYFG